MFPVYVVKTITIQRYKWLLVFEQVHEILVLIAFSTNKGSDESAQMREYFHYFYTQDMGVDEDSDNNKKKTGL